MASTLMNILKKIYNSAGFLSDVFKHIGKGQVYSILQTRHWGIAMLNDKQDHTDKHGRSKTQSQDIFRVSSVDFPLTIYFHKTNQKKKKVWASLYASFYVMRWKLSLNNKSWWFNGMKTILGIKTPRNLNSCR